MRRLPWLRWHWPQTAVAAAVVFGGLLLAVVLASLVTTAGNAAENTEDLLEQLRQSQIVRAEQAAMHRKANQADHDCIVALILINGDPNRNRELPPDLPPSCRVAPAADHATDNIDPTTLTEKD